MADTAGYHASTAPEDFFKKTYESHFLEVSKDSSSRSYSKNSLCKLTLVYKTYLKLENNHIKLFKGK